MKKTIWQPVVLGVAFGLLAGIAMVSGLSFLLSSTEASNAIGFYMTLFLLSAAIGGPLAGAITSTICVTFVAFFGPPEMREVLSDPINLWSNLFVTGMLVALIGFAYRMIFERVKMPARLLPWAGIVIAYYVISGPINISIQFYLHGEAGILPAILDSYRTYIPQALFDIFFTSLVFIALPSSYTRPRWYESKKTPREKRLNTQESMTESKREVQLETERRYSVQVKKTIWIPIVGGLIFGALSFLISAANITITISKELILGPWEIFNTISAALFGPIGLLITQLGMDIGGYLFLINGVFPAPYNVYFILCEYTAHSISLLVVAFGYKFIYTRMKMPLLLAGWVLILSVYYVMLAILQVFLYNTFVPEVEATYMFYFNNIPVELTLIIVITSLILLGLPARYRKPQWYESKQTTDRNRKIQGK